MGNVDVDLVRRTRQPRESDRVKFCSPEKEAVLAENTESDRYRLPIHASAEVCFRPPSTRGASGGRHDPQRPDQHRAAFRLHVARIETIAFHAAEHLAGDLVGARRRSET